MAFWTSLFLVLACGTPPPASNPPIVFAPLSHDQSIEKTLCDDVLGKVWGLDKQQQLIVLDKLNYLRFHPDYDAMLVRLVEYAVSLKPEPVEPSLWDDALDGTVVAPNSHIILVETPHVRILEIIDQPDLIVPYHTHKWDSLMLVLEPSPIWYKDANGERIYLAVYSVEHILPEPLHTIKNVGGTTFRALRFELKS